MADFTEAQLAEFDGRDGRPAYVAYKGVVYDVSDSAMWDEGDHLGSHSAGADLTDEHDDAPHEERIVDFPEVGRLA
jgi:predicted heme/steroid binding protein